MIPLTYDLHIHSVLSPCGDKDMTPYNIVAMSKLKGLDVIALTDHNSCKNCPSFVYHGEQMGMITIPGIELCTVEEVHVVILFPSLEKAMEFDSYVEHHRVNVENKEEIFGEQIILDNMDQEIDREKMLLLTASDISFFDLSSLLEEYGGVMIPAHIDRTSYSLLSNLGFVPLESTFLAYEIYEKDRKDNLMHRNPYLKECKLLHNSDAHYLENIKEAEEVIYVRERTIDGVLGGIVGRRG